MEFFLSPLFNEATVKAYLRFEGDVVDTKELHNGSNTNLSWGTDYGVFNQGVLFNGTTAFCTFTDHADFKPTGNFSVGMRFKTSAAGTLFTSTYFTTDPAVDKGLRLSVTAAHKLRAYIVDSLGNYGEIVSTASVDDGAWHFCVFTYDGTNVNLYLEGASAATPVAANAAVYHTTNYVSLGRNYEDGASSALFNGSMDDFFFFNGKALNLAEVSSLYETISQAQSLPMWLEV